MKILIIGSKGFIGSHAYQHFSELKDYECWGCDVVVDYVDDHYFLVDSFNSYFNDVFEKASFDVCINCSGAASVPDSLNYPLRDFNLNVSNVCKLLEAIRRYAPHCRFINLSSAAVYGNPSTLPVNTRATPHPLSPYGWHKLFSEQLCEEYYTFFGLPTLSLRIFSAFGPGLKKQLFWDLYHKAKELEIVEIYGSGNESRDFIYIDDIIQVIEMAIEHGNFNGSCVNVANGEEVYIKDAADTFLNYLGKKYRFKGEIKKGDPVNWVADISEIKSWGYKSKIRFSAGLLKYIEWAREFG
jgi:UDP-glucose 4-epimerase